MLLFWTSCVLRHGFQSQSGYLACTLSCLHAVILKVTSGATPAFSTNRGVHCISMYMAWRLVMFPTCHVCNKGRLPGFNRETSRVVSGHAVHSATATGVSWTIVSRHRFHCNSWTVVSRHRFHCNFWTVVSRHRFHCNSWTVVSRHRFLCNFWTVVSRQRFHCNSWTVVSRQRFHCNSWTVVSRQRFHCNSWTVVSRQRFHCNSWTVVSRQRFHCNSWTVVSAHRSQSWDSVPSPPSLTDPPRS